MIGKWTFEEKRGLLNGLQKYGSTNLQAIRENLPFKSVSEIRMAIRYYQRLAANAEKNETPDGERQEAPVDTWIQLLKPRLSNINCMSLVCKCLAHFENHTDTSAVNMKDCYEVLSALLIGETPKKMNPDTAQFITKCLMYVAQEVKGSDTQVEEEFLRNVILGDVQKVTKTYGRPKKPGNCVENILNVPDELLAFKVCSSKPDH